MFRNKQGMNITYVGHATVLIETNETRILTDPVLRNRIGFLRRYKYEFKTEWYKSIDAVLISHSHSDHFDRLSLSFLDNSTKIIVPKDMLQSLKRNGFYNSKGVKVNDFVEIGGVTVKVTPAIHQSRWDFLNPTAKKTPVGYIIEGDHSVYFPGDTDLFDEMVNLKKDLDVALLPIWGWGPILGPGHLDPKSAAKALKLLNPSIVIPIHWGTFHPVGFGWLKHALETPKDFSCYAEELAPEVEVRIIQPGGHTRISIQNKN